MATSPINRSTTPGLIWGDWTIPNQSKLKILIVPHAYNTLDIMVDLNPPIGKFVEFLVVDDGSLMGSFFSFLVA